MTVLETAGYEPINIAVGVSVFVALLLLMAIVHGVGHSRPHS